MTRNRLAALGAAVLLVLGSIGLATPAHAAGSGGFRDGQIAWSDIISCTSIIFPPMYEERGAGAWVGSYSDPEANQPGVNQPFAIRVVVGGVGNACSGQRFVPGFTLPAGLTLDTSYAPECYFDGQLSTLPADCPGHENILHGTHGANSFSYLSTDSNHANMWPLPNGRTIELRFAVKASAPIYGTLQGHVTMADGNENPTLRPTAPINVFSAVGAPPSTGDPEYRFLFDAPSTIATSKIPETTTPTGFGLYSEGVVYTNGKAGALVLQRGSSPTSFPSSASWAVDSSFPAWKLWTDWADLPGFADLVPGQRYYWRLGFLPQGGSAPVFGPAQQFVALEHATCLGDPITVSLANGQAPTDGADVILGTPGADVINALDGDDVVCSLGGNDVIDLGPGADGVDAGSGNDTVIALSGNDRVLGGAGSDTVSYAGHAGSVIVNLGVALQRTGSAGDDTLESIENVTGGAGNDVLTGNGSANRLQGGTGTDSLVGGSGSDSLLGGAGNDTLRGGDGADSLDGGAGNDVLYGDAGDDSLRGDAGNDSLFGHAGDDSLRGDAGDDSLRGGDGVDSLAGGDGADTLAGEGGKDKLDGQAGNDRLDGGASDDSLAGGSENDSLTGGSGNDSLTGGSGNDSLTGGSGNDSLDGGAGNDTVRGAAGNDTARGGVGTDKVYGDDGKDKVYGDAGNDKVYGGAGTDKVYGGADNDKAYGGSGNDRVYGQAGKDKIYGQAGKDKLDGGSGKDYGDGGTGKDTAKSCESKKRVP